MNSLKKPQLEDFSTVLNLHQLSDPKKKKQLKNLLSSFRCRIRIKKHGDETNCRIRIDTQCMVYLPTILVYCLYTYASFYGALWGKGFFASERFNRPTSQSWRRWTWHEKSRRTRCHGPASTGGWLVGW